MAAKSTSPAQDQMEIDQLAETELDRLQKQVSLKKVSLVDLLAIRLHRLRTNLNRLFSLPL